MDDTTTLELDQWELLILERAMERMDLKNAHGQGLVALLGKIRKAQGRNEMQTITQQAVALAIESNELTGVLNTLQLLPLGSTGRSRWTRLQERQYRDAQDKSIQVSKDLQALEEQMTSEEGTEAVRLYQAHFMRSKPLQELHCEEE